jgi:exodeoxyribonuclease III
MKLVSWNVNGVRAIVKKDFEQIFNSIDADIFCFQETKAQDDQVAEALQNIKGYHLFSNSAEKLGYSGTAILSKEKPISVKKGIGIAEHDTEGRVLCAEFPDFYFVTVYVPNSGSELKRLGYRQEWDKAFCDYLKNLEKTKPVVFCGDLNVAYQPIDLARPKENYNKAAGYMQEEINGFDLFVKAGFVDSFRFMHPTEAKYSWWSLRGGARERNVGWRIDYFLTSPSLCERYKKADILTATFGSDHCPVLLEI